MCGSYALRRRGNRLPYLGKIGSSGKYRTLPNTGIGGVVVAASNSKKRRCLEFDCRTDLVAVNQYKRDGKSG